MVTRGLSWRFRRLAARQSRESVWEGCHPVLFRLLSDTAPKRAAGRAVRLPVRPQPNRRLRCRVAGLIRGSWLRRGAQSVRCAVGQDDYGTALLNGRVFYKHLFVEGQPAAIAASTARRFGKAGERKTGSRGQHWLLGTQPAGTTTASISLLDSPWLWAGSSLAPPALRSWYPPTEPHRNGPTGLATGKSERDQNLRSRA